MIAVKNVNVFKGCLRYGRIGGIGMLLDVIQVQANPDFSLIVWFENGEKRYFNMGAYMDQKPWKRLREKDVFLKAFVQNGTVAWPGNMDIDPETLYEYSRNLEKQSDFV
jgi:hypothetical protein